MSLLVVICRPAAAFWGAFARTVSPMQVTVTGPAGMFCPEVKVSVRASVPFVNAVPADDVGTVTPHAVLAALAVIRLAGKVRTMASPTLLAKPKLVAVVKEMVAVPVSVGLAENPDSVGRVTQPTQGVATCAA